MAEPKTEDQLNFLTSLADVEEMATGVQGWWVGLADLGHEGEWVWPVYACIESFTDLMSLIIRLMIIIVIVVRCHC